MEFKIGNNHKDFYVLDWFSEYWLPVKGYEGLYEISNWGRVKSVDHYVINQHKNGYRIVKGKIRKQQKGRNGYCHISMTDGSIEGYKIKKIHRLVAETFLPNPDNLPVVNHKDENTNNNCVWNLEWCTVEYNNNYGGHQQRCQETHKKKREEKNGRNKI